MQPLDRLSALDATFLYAESERMPMHVGVFGVLDRLRADPDELIEYIERKTAFEPRTRMRVQELPAAMGRPVLVTDPNFDIRQHVRVLSAPRPYNDESADVYVAEMMMQTLRRDRPLWMLRVFDMTGDRTGVVMCIHHCLMDGIGGVAFALGFLSTEPDGHLAPDGPPPQLPPLPARWELLAGSAAGMVSDQVVAARSAVRAAVPGGPLMKALSSVPSILSGALSKAGSGRSKAAFAAVGSDRVFARVSVDLERVKAVKNTFGCKLNDVMLTCVAAGLRATLMSSGRDPARTTLRASLPVNMRPGGDEARNLVSQMVVELPVALSDPLERIEAVTRNTTRSKASGLAGLTSAMLGMADAAPPVVLKLASKAAAFRAPADILATNLPGPPVPLYLMGARVREVYPFAPLAGTSAVSVAIVSYAGSAFVGVSADPKTLPDPGYFTKELAGELDTLSDLSVGGAPR